MKTPKFEYPCPRCGIAREYKSDRYILELDAKGHCTKCFLEQDPSGNFQLAYKQGKEWRLPCLHCPFIKRFKHKSSCRSSIKKGATCKSCINRKKTSSNEVPEDTLWNLQLNQIRNRAKATDIPFSLRVSDLKNIWTGYCAYSNREIVLEKPSVSVSNKASLDRKNNTKGYVKDNVVWCHKTINKMKNTLPLEEFLSFCREVSDNNH